MTWPTGWTILPSLVDGFDVFTSAISNDGNVICGVANDADGKSHAVYWTQSGGIVDLGFLPGCDQSFAYDLSADGSTIVGECNLIAGGTLAFKWTQAGGMVTISLSGSRPSAGSVSDDGSVIGVIAAGQGVWTLGGGFVAIPLLPGDTFAGGGPTVSPDGTRATNISQLSSHWVTWTQAGGSVDLGVVIPPPPFSSFGSGPVIANDGSSAEVGTHNNTFGYVYVANPIPTLTELGTLPGGTFSFAESVLLDGSLVSGAADDADGNSQPFYWTAAAGMVQLTGPVGYSGYDGSSEPRSMQRTGEAVVGQFQDGTNVSHGAVYVFTATPPGVSITGVSATAGVGELRPPGNWVISSSLTTEAMAGIGDVWMNDSYLDFSDAAVRAKFVNTDGTWKNLGVYGELPTGSSPLNWLRVQTGNDATDILTGYGQNGSQTAWTLRDIGLDPTTGLPYAAMSLDICPPFVAPIIPGPGDGSASAGFAAHGSSQTGGDKIRVDDEGDQWQQYLAWRDKQWRKRQAQKGILVNEPNIPPAPPAPVLAPARTPSPQVQFHGLTGRLQQLQQQMTVTRSLVPVTPAPQPPAPTPAPPLTGLPSQLEALRRQMKKR